MDLRACVYKTVHRRKMSVEEIADRIGVSPSLLYRTANPNDTSAKFALERLLPLMETTRDFSILRHLAARAGFALFRIPARLKVSRPADLLRFQRISNSCVAALLSFSEGGISKEKCLNEIDALLSASCEMRRSVETDQLTFEFDK